MSLILRGSTNLALWAATLLLAQQAAGQSSGIRTYCNPIDIDYKYNFEQITEGISYRSGADPVIGFAIEAFDESRLEGQRSGAFPLSRVFRSARSP